MAWFTYVAVFIIIWWLVLFMVLPVGVRTAYDTNQPLGPGHASSAPVRPRILLKFLVTTAITVVLFTVYWLMQHYDVFGVDEMFR